MHASYTQAACRLQGTAPARHACRPCRAAGHGRRSRQASRYIRRQQACVCALARAVSSLSSDPPAPAAGPGARPGHARARRRVRPFFARVAGAVPDTIRGPGREAVRWWSRATPTTREKIGAGGPGDRHSSGARACIAAPCVRARGTPACPTLSALYGACTSRRTGLSLFCPLVLMPCLVMFHHLCTLDLIKAQLSGNGKWQLRSHAATVSLRRFDPTYIRLSHFAPPKTLFSTYSSLGLRHRFQSSWVSFRQQYT